MRATAHEPRSVVHDGDRAVAAIRGHPRDVRSSHARRRVLGLGQAAGRATTSAAPPSGRCCCWVRPPAQVRSRSSSRCAPTRAASRRSRRRWPRPMFPLRWWSSCPLPRRSPPAARCCPAAGACTCATARAPPGSRPLHLRSPGAGERHAGGRRARARRGARRFVARRWIRRPLQGRARGPAASIWRWTRARWRCGPGAAAGCGGGRGALALAARDGGRARGSPAAARVRRGQTRARRCLACSRAARRDGCAAGGGERGARLPAPGARRRDRRSHRLLRGPDRAAWAGRRARVPGAGAHQT